MLRRAIVAVTLLLFTAIPAIAQSIAEDSDEIAPDSIPPLAYERPLIEYVCAILFVLLAMGIGFMPSKRVKDA